MPGVINLSISKAIDHFTAVDLVACPLNESEGGVEVVLRGL